MILKILRVIFLPVEVSFVAMSIFLMAGCAIALWFAPTAALLWFVASVMPEDTPFQPLIALVTFIIGVGSTTGLMKLLE